jgi:hypothetical protein
MPCPDGLDQYALNAELAEIARHFSSTVAAVPSDH